MKNVNKLLKSIGCESVNQKNRDEVLMALDCYGKVISKPKNKNKVSSIIKKNKHSELMKNLIRHPRLFKKTALTLKRLITNKVKFREKRKISMVNQK